VLLLIVFRNLLFFYVYFGLFLVLNFESLEHLFRLVSK
jgi:hypothetical protein